MRSMIKALALCALAWPTLGVARQVPIPYEIQETLNDAYYTALTPAEKRQAQLYAEQSKPLVMRIMAEEAAVGREMLALNLSELLTPAFRKRDRDGALTRARLDQGRALVQRGERLRAQHDAEGLDGVARSGMSPKLKAHYRAVFERTVTELRPKRARLSAISLETFDTIEQCSRLLETAEWGIQGGQYAFSSELDLQTFSQHLQRLDALQREGNMILALLARRRTEAMSRF